MAWISTNQGLSTVALWEVGMMLRFMKMFHNFASGWRFLRLTVPGFMPPFQTIEDVVDGINVGRNEMVSDIYHRVFPIWVMGVEFSDDVDVGTRRLPAKSQLVHPLELILEEPFESRSWAILVSNLVGKESTEAELLLLRLENEDEELVVLAIAAKREKEKRENFC
ncbi:hypothetical protein V6N13_101309 [Hibiscus sabdariffa]